MDFFNFLKERKLIVLSISLIINIILMIVGIYFFVQSRDTMTITNDDDSYLAKSNITTENVIEDSFYVEVKGAVSKPGVYQVKTNDIINDVINMAGGFTKVAYTKNINLSRKLTSELVIYVYTKSEYNKINSKDNDKIGIKEQVCLCPTYDINSCVETGSSEIVTEIDNIKNDDNVKVVNSLKENTTSDNQNESNNRVLININTASKENLIELSGIGDSKANDIINYRNVNGPFKNIEELKNVSGIGSALFEKIKDYITV